MCELEKRIETKPKADYCSYTKQENLNLYLIKPVMASYKEYKLSQKYLFIYWLELHNSFAYL